jgi:quinol-cytochrome oxidoreductase complex cytochrome b subunit
MKKSIAIVLILVAIVLCTCPTLFLGVGTFATTSSPEGIATVIANSQQITGINIAQSDVGPAITMARFISASGICLGLVIPLVVGLITFRMARKQGAQALRSQ